MRILHTSDWHLGRTIEGESRFKEQQDFIDEIINILEEQKIDLVLIAGDIFDTYNPPAKAEKLFFEAVEQMSDNGKRGVIAIAGNHDSPDRLRAANPLAKKQGIFLLGYPGEDDKGNGSNRVNGDAVQKIAGGEGWIELSVPGCAHNAVIYALPYPSEQRLNQVLTSSLDDDREMQQAYSERVATAFGEGASHFKEDTVNLAVSHLFVLGGYTSESERDIMLGGAFVVEPASMPANAHYVALGHLHRPQKVGGTKVPCRYSGSPLYYSFSEVDQQKEVVIVDAAPGKETKVDSIKLKSGKPMFLKRFNSFQEAHDWCSREENKEVWLHLEIESPEPLSNAKLEELNSIHQGIIYRRVILPGVEITEEKERRLSQLSLEEKFDRYVTKMTGAKPEEELVKLFLELSSGGDVDETD